MALSTSHMEVAFAKPTLLRLPSSVSFLPLELFSENLTFVPSRGTKEGNRTPNGECLYDINIGLRRGYITTRVNISSPNLGFTPEPGMLGTPALAVGLATFNGSVEQHISAIRQCSAIRKGEIHDGPFPPTAAPSDGGREGGQDRICSL